MRIIVLVTEEGTIIRQHRRILGKRIICEDMLEPLPEVARPLFWSAGPLSAAQQTTEMIAD
jgi:hypothetical protein